MADCIDPCATMQDIVQALASRGRWAAVILKGDATSLSNRDEGTGLVCSHVPVSPEEVAVGVATWLGKFCKDYGIEMTFHVPGKPPE